MGVSMPNRKRAVVWFRKDLRLEDHPALLAALSDGLEIIPIFIWDPKASDIWRPGEASRWWLHQSLLYLRQSIDRLGGSILFLIGQSLGNSVEGLSGLWRVRFVLWQVLRAFLPSIGILDRKNILSIGYSLSVLQLQSSS